MQLLAELPADVREVIERHEAQGYTSCPEYLGAVAVFYQRHLCRLQPWPAGLERSFAEMSPVVYETMNGPSEFTVTGRFRDWDVFDRLGEIHVPALVMGGRHDEIRVDHLDRHPQGHRRLRARDLREQLAHARSTKSASCSCARSTSSWTVWRAPRADARRGAGVGPSGPTPAPSSRSASPQTRSRRLGAGHNPGVRVGSREGCVIMRKSLIVLAVLLVLVAVPVAVLAAGGVLSSDVNRQKARWTTTSVSTSSMEWRNVPGLSRLTADTIDEVSATLSVTVQGAPVRFRVVIDTPEGPMRPGPVRFAPSGVESFSFTFVRNTVPFEGDDTHVFTVQWRSPSGAKVTLLQGVLNLVYELGTNGAT